MCKLFNPQLLCQSRNPSGFLVVNSTRLIIWGLFLNCKKKSWRFVIFKMHGKNMQVWVPYFLHTIYNQALCYLVFFLPTPVVLSLFIENCCSDHMCFFLLLFLQPFVQKAEKDDLIFRIDLLREELEKQRLEHKDERKICSEFRDKSLQQSKLFSFWWKRLYLTGGDGVSFHCSKTYKGYSFCYTYMQTWWKGEGFSPLPEYQKIWNEITFSDL